MTIWKYPIAVTDAQSLLMPKGAQILSAQFQNGNLCLWALVDADKEKVRREIYIFSTRCTAAFHNMRFIATAQEASGFFVWHVFESTL